MKTAVHPNSIEAYHGLKLSHRQSQVVEALQVLGKATDLQICDFLNLPINSVTGRITELKALGEVIECGHVERVIDGKTCHARKNRLKSYQETLF